MGGSPPALKPQILMDWAMLNTLDWAMILTLPDSAIWCTAKWLGRTVYESESAVHINDAVRHSLSDDG